MRSWCDGLVGRNNGVYFSLCPQFRPKPLSHGCYFLICMLGDSIRDNGEV